MGKPGKARIGEGGEALQDNTRCVLDDVVEQMVIEVGPESEDSSSSETESSKDED